MHHQVHFFPLLQTRSPSVPSRSDDEEEEASGSRFRRQSPKRTAASTASPVKSRANGTGGRSGYRTTISISGGDAEAVEIVQQRRQQQPNGDAKPPPSHARNGHGSRTRAKVGSPPLSTCVPWRSLLSLDIWVQSKRVPLVLPRYRGGPINHCNVSCIGVIGESRSKLFDRCIE